VGPGRRALNRGRHAPGGPKPRPPRWRRCASSCGPTRSPALPRWATRWCGLHHLLAHRRRGVLIFHHGSLYTAERAEGVGWKVARVTALNTAGSILGSLLTGFVVVPALGLQNSALALVALNLVVGFAAVWFFGSAALRLRLAAAAMVVAAIVAALLQWVPLHSMSIADYLSVLRTFQSVFPNATLWYTGGSHTLLLATPERLTDAGLEGMLQAAYDVPAVLQDLGEPGQIPRYWIMNSEQLREFAGQGELVRDNDAFFLPINAETQELIQVIQLAAVRASP
jgi:hypothetical protein